MATDHVVLAGPDKDWKPICDECGGDLVMTGEADVPTNGCTSEALHYTRWAEYECPKCGLVYDHRVMTWTWKGGKK